MVGAKGAHRQPTQTDIEEGSKNIQDIAQSGQPFLVGRNGSTELQLLYFYITWRTISGKPYPDNLKQGIHIYSGVFPESDTLIDEWCKTYLESLSELDITVAGWYKPLFSVEMGVLGKYAPPHCPRIPLRSLEPYYSGSQHWWTHALAGHKICVVSSFAETIKKQVESGATGAIWRGAQAGLLDISGAQWSFVKAGYAPSIALGRGGWPAGVHSWRDAIDLLEREVVATGASTALIGCGGLGLILGARLKKRGISAIILGGAIQVLFGIKGKRWETHDIISKFWNPFWVWPAADEIPGGAQFVEGGCYWR